MMRLTLLSVFLLLFSCCMINGTEDVHYISTLDTVSYIKEVKCRYSESDDFIPPKCLRSVRDDIFSINEASTLLALANKGMALRESKGGPTILDINTGYIRDSQGLVNLFETENSIFEDSDFQNYGNIIKKLKSTIEDMFSLQNKLYFTAPTFITRLDGRNDWNPKEIHDEYWHVHSDRNNTQHYHISGLMYLNTYKDDYTGGNMY